MELIVINRSWRQFGKERKEGRKTLGGGETGKGRTGCELELEHWTIFSLLSQSVSLSPALVSRPDRSMENRACAILWGGRMRRFKVRVGDFPGSSGYFANRIRSIRCCGWDP